MEIIVDSEVEQYKEIEVKESFIYQTHIHASHIMFWCKDYRQNPTVIYALMQLRCDGLFGFPGGKSDEKVIDHKQILDTLCRELDEEINYKSCEISMDDHLFSHIGTHPEIVLHFFAKELPIEVFEFIERTHMNARDFSKESLGLFRIPLNGQSKDILRFFSGFAKQNFAGNARNQLLESVIKLNLFGKNDVKEIAKLME